MREMAQWLGYMVSIKCADDTAYQGEIKSASTAEIVLAKAFCNGIPCTDSQVTIRADQIGELKLIDKQPNSLQPKSSTITIAKPIAKRAARTQSASEPKVTPSEVSATTSSSSSAAKQHPATLPASSSQTTRSKPIDIEVKNSSSSSASHGHNHTNESTGSSLKNNTPGRKEKSKAKWTKGWRDEECFGSPLDHKINKEFDFEKNLALFDKEAIWEQLNSSQRPDVVKSVEPKRPQKYRHDENVLGSLPMTYRQIIVPKQDFCEYVTDDGLIIPSISRSLRKRMWEAADRVGLTWDRRVELLGRAAAEISIQLLGGGHRLNPHNSHQVPTVVVLCGPNKQGSVGLNTARQLTSHGVTTIVHAVSSEAPLVKKELSLYALTRNRLAHAVGDLPALADLIIVALCEDSDSPRSYPDISGWVGRNKAPVLAIDPPSGGTPGIVPKYSLLPVLPLPHSARSGKLYLCNLGFPLEIFDEVGIKYKSPFGPKFVIPLHPKEY